MKELRQLAYFIFGLCILWIGESLLHEVSDRYGTLCSLRAFCQPIDETVENLRFLILVSSVCIPVVLSLVVNFVASSLKTEVSHKTLENLPKT